MSELLWYAAHTRPRREKKLVEFCAQHELQATLPCYNSPHQYRGKTAVFQKPLFPGYVFLQLQPTQTALVRQNDHVANLLDIFDQATFEKQLQEILVALASGLEVHLAPNLTVGTRVRIRSGPLQGIEGLIEARSGPRRIFLRLDFINQAAAVELGAEVIEPI